MASGQFSRGKENIRADDSLIMVGATSMSTSSSSRRSVISSADAV
jgi:predicted ATP-dependent Lon-type protease